MTKKTLTIEEAAQELDFSISNIYMLARQNKLTKFYYNKRNFVIVKDKKFNFYKLKNDINNEEKNND